MTRMATALQRNGHARTSRAGRPSLGDRAIMTASLPAVVRLAAEADAAAHGMDRGTLLTDLVCRFYGREDLVRRLPQPVLFAETRRGAAEFTEADRDSSMHVKVRPPRPVADLIEADAEARGIARPTLLSDIICGLMGYQALVRELDCKEALPLAM